MAITAFRYSSLLDPQRFQSLGQATFPPTPIPATPGMVLLTDYTITHAGTSATLTNGQVTFTAVTSLSLNGVFTADFDNYVVNASTIATGNASFYFRLRASGSDATGTDYTSQQLQATGGPPGIAVNRQTNNYGRCGAVSITLRSGTWISVYGPYLSQPTATRNTDGNGAATARIDDFANTHSLSTSYDGITLYPSANSISGSVVVYGVRS